MEVSGQLKAAATLPPRKEPPVPMEQEAGWAPEPIVNSQNCVHPQSDILNSAQVSNEGFYWLQ
jgi:hypothetical protein